MKECEGEKERGGVKERRRVKECEGEKERGGVKERRREKECEGEKEGEGERRCEGARVSGVTVSQCHSVRSQCAQCGRFHLSVYM